MKQETQFISEIRTQDNAEKVFKQILPELKTLTFKNYQVVAENLASAIEQNQWFCPRGAVYKAVRRLVVQNRGQLQVQQSLLAVVLTSSEVRLAQRKLELELEIHRDSISMLKRATLAEMLPDLRSDINLSEGDTIIMLRRLNTRLDWGLGDSDIHSVFDLNHPEQPE